MRTRTTKKFAELLTQYEAMTNCGNAKTSFFFTKLQPNAKNFTDWSVIYNYGDASVRKDALLKMKGNVIRGLSRSEIQLNILELLIVIDNDDKREVLKRYLKRFHKEQDFLFVFDIGDWNDSVLMKYIDNEMKKYGIDVDASVGSEERMVVLDRLILSSKFYPISRPSS